MSIFSSIPLIGKIIDKGFDLIDEVVEDKDEANALKAELTAKWQDVDLNKYIEQIQAQSAVIVAEAKGDSWLQRNWRPGIMAMFGFIVFNNYVLYPYLSLLWPAAPILETPPELWALMKLGISGYIVGRSTEKGIELWKGKKKGG